MKNKIGRKLNSIKLSAEFFSMVNHSELATYISQHKPLYYTKFTAFVKQFKKIYLNSSTSFLNIAKPTSNKIEKKSFT